MAGEATVRQKFEVLRTRKRISVRPEDFLSAEHQTNLFPTPRRGLIIFVYFPEVTEEEFRSTLEYARPSSIIELRSAPRFDIGTLNRRLAFRAFENHNSTYIDLARPGEASDDFDQTLWECKSILKDSKTNLGRPLMFLMSKDDVNQGIPRIIRQMVSSILPDYNEVFEVPHFS
jgi:hypothetical protein